MPVTRYLVTRYSNLTTFFSNDPLGTSCGWGSSRPVALLTTPPEARCAARLDVFLGGEVLIRGAGAFLLVCRGAVSVGAAEGGDRLEGTGYGGRRQRLWTRVGPVRSPQLQRPLGEPSVRAGGGPPAVSNKGATPPGCGPADIASHLGSREPATGPSIAVPCPLGSQPARQTGRAGEDQRSSLARQSGACFDDSSIQ
ncbi:unnamed protein product [Pleuronectes platessa]|uniref:Uncharacterized protein n=1 Tax=Pleuronectes platessa TaxID=8262 RepID=A0A9N7ZB76_PLEPL|nr:unnamed protein product [Pleuronectes platessa]